MSWRNLIWMCIVLCLAGAAVVLSRRGPLPTPASPGHDPDAKALAPAARAYKQIRAHARRTPALGTRAGEQVARDAIEGIVRGLDKFSTYVPPDQVDPLQRRIRGIVRETGLRIAADADRLVVVGALPGSPAAQARLPQGAEILALNDVPAAELTLQDAREMLQAPAAPAVRLALAGSPRGPDTLTLPVEPFDLETVTGIVRAPDGQWVHDLDARRRIFYIRIAEFVPKRTPEDFQAAFRGLDDPAGLVLDLRDNPGGPLPAALAIAERFLERGLIVRTVARGGEQTAYAAHAGEVYPPVGLAVLVNERTASAAEIVAGALQRHRRAVLVGQPSYGKWCVQTPFDLDGGLGRVYLTTAEYFLTPAEEPGDQPATSPARPTGAAAGEGATTRPGRAWPQGRRVYPDVAVRPAAGEAEQLALLRLRAEVMPSPAGGPPNPEAHEALRRAILDRDVQLAAALRLLRAGKAPTTQPAATRPRSAATP